MTHILGILDKIDAMTAPLNPPVKAFELSIRRSPFRVLISVLLSSRTRDPVTLAACERLFDAADTPQKMNRLSEDEIARLIFPVGFYRQKAGQIKKITAILGDDPIPETFDGLVRLPGVGRKTANLVLALAFDTPAIAVDTHVFRIARRLGWARGGKPEIVEEELKQTVPSTLWNRINQTLVAFGQTLCKPSNPQCGQCTITAACAYFTAGRPADWNPS